MKAPDAARLAVTGAKTVPYSSNWGTFGNSKRIEIWNPCKFCGFYDVMARNNSVWDKAKDSFPNCKQTSTGWMYSSEVLLQPEEHINRSREMSSKFLFCFENILTVTAKPFRGSLAMLRTEEKQMYELKTRFIHAQHWQHPSWYWDLNCSEQLSAQTARTAICPKSFCT